MPSFSFIASSSRQLVTYALIITVATIGYNSLANFQLISIWSYAATLSLIVFPVVTYLFLQQITIKHYNGKIKFVPLFLLGIAVHILASLLVSTVLFTTTAMGVDIYNKPISSNYPQLLVNFLYWYVFFGCVSSLLAIGILWLKSIWRSAS